MNRAPEVLNATLMVMQYNVPSFHNVGGSSLPTCLEGSKAWVTAWSDSGRPNSGPWPPSDALENPALFQDAGHITKIVMLVNH